MKKEPILIKIENDEGKLLFAIRLVNVEVNFDKELISDIFTLFYKKSGEKYVVCDEEKTKTNGTNFK